MSLLDEMHRHFITSVTVTSHTTWLSGFIAQKWEIHAVYIHFTQLSLYKLEGVCLGRDGLGDVWIIEFDKCMHQYDDMKDVCLCMHLYASLHVPFQNCMLTHAVLLLQRYVPYISIGILCEPIIVLECAWNLQIMISIVIEINHKIHWSTYSVTVGGMWSTIIYYTGNTKANRHTWFKSLDC